MADETKRLNALDEGTQRLQQETERLMPEKTEKLGVEIKKAFPVFLRQGEIVEDRYKVTSVLSQHSGEGIIYLCDDLKENQKVILKLYHTGFIPKEEIVKKLVGMSHSDIIAILNFGYLDSQFYEIMEYAPGGTVLERLQEKPFSEEELTTHIIPQVLNGIKFCHNNGIIHRDIKPANIFYREKERKDVVIGDFGISTVLEQGVSVRKTKGALTIDYAAPELFGWKGEVYVDKEADYYAFGITLIHLFMGMSPFAGQTELQIMTQHTSGSIPLPDNISPRFKKLLSGLLVKERKKRWGASEIEQWLKGVDVSVYEDVPKVEPTISPYKFTAGALAKTPKELAMLIQTQEQVLVKRHFSKGWISEWVAKFDTALASKISEVAEKQRDIDLALLEISYLLDSDIPYILSPDKQAQTLEELAILIDKNWEVGKRHIFSGKISLWLTYAGYSDVYEKLEQIRKEYAQEQDKGVEIFLQILGLPKPEFSVEPLALDAGIIESTAGKVTNPIKLIHTGKRGYLYGEVRFLEKVEGISFATENVPNVPLLATKLEEEKQYIIMKLMKEAQEQKDEQAFLELEGKLKEIGKSIHQKKQSKATPNITDEVVKLSLWHGESVEFALIIDTKKLSANKKHEFSLYSKTNTAVDINLPVSLFIDYPAYSKKPAKNSVEIDGKGFYTIADLAKYCYETIPDNPESIHLLSSLSDKLIVWIKNELEEGQITSVLKRIISANISESEKYYRLLNLSGVFAEGELIDFFKKLRLKEFEIEKALRIANVKSEIHNRIIENRNEKRRRSFNRSLRTGTIIGTLLGIIIEIIIGIIEGIKYVKFREFFTIPFAFNLCVLCG